MAKEWEVEIVDLVCTVEGNTRKASQERVRPPGGGSGPYVHTHIPWLSFSSASHLVRRFGLLHIHIASLA